MSPDQNTIKNQDEAAICPGPQTPTENHCVNCEYDGLREHRTLCLHPLCADREFWIPTPDNKCQHFVLWSKRRES